MFKKVLIANRGEIAVRIIRACRELGIRPVAIYSEADRGALHVHKADEAYAIGPAVAKESYLNISRILDAAKKSQAEAIHPGYGFLSENAKFAAACADAGIKFIGPLPGAMEMMGSKTSARRAMAKAGIPRIAGSDQAIGSVEEVRDITQGIGFPVLLKAAAGGGGKGMRLVETAEELRSAVEAAQSEAQRAFGNSEIYVEKYFRNPRHIEIQVLADEHGNAVHLGERECSLQRRHQKVLEESPSAIIGPEMRRRMGETAIHVVKIAGYRNAGTVEFLVDQNQNFYFLEMNTRLQVEHPVTEMVTGIDLVHLQLRIAAGEKLPFRQEDISLRGHAIECRIYAEDPDNNFFPSPGLITELDTPAGPGIREDSGIYKGWRVPLDYDPLLSKLIAWAPTREMAIQRLMRAVDEYFIGGIATNLRLFRRILSDYKFGRAEIDTGYLERLLAAQDNSGSDRGVAQMAAIAAAIFAAQDAPASATRVGAPSASELAWKKTARQESLR